MVSIISNSLSFSILICFFLFKSTLSHSTIIKEPDLRVFETKLSQECYSIKKANSTNNRSNDRKFYWKNNGRRSKSDLSVVDQHGRIIYNVTYSKNVTDSRDQGFEITDAKRKTLLKVADTHRSLCAFKYGYHDNIGDEFKIDPRGALPDYWKLKFPKGNETYRYTYRRRRHHPMLV
ncbi:expressed protein [Phakopsora pachyrhizi]|uniref:Expressed protein n=1 Tax=Phakopsora pachyrhizi TaxID=170000 RepID=A0AAV0BN28_PHAPC|nr:expressed protein [Phakopsora pachyrhizi]